MKNSQDIDADLVRKLAGLLDETNLTEIEFASGEFRLRVARQAIAAPTAFAPAPAQLLQPATQSEPGAAAEDLATHPGAVRSPMVGTTYLSPQPGAAPFVRVGDPVSMGDTLLIIEAMKVMNQIRAPKSGKVTRILVEDAGPVEFGQVVMLIE
jgi:acetyl-CoA carboxylase biotin carboxyl carrier protein